MSDLAVDESLQAKGIGKSLIRLSNELKPTCSLILLAAPLAQDYYAKIGFEKHNSAWILHDVKQLK